MRPPGRRSCRPIGVLQARLRHCRCLAQKLRPERSAQPGHPLPCCGFRPALRASRQRTAPLRVRPVRDRSKHQRQRLPAVRERLSQPRPSAETQQTPMFRPYRKPQPSPLPQELPVPTRAVPENRTLQQPWKPPILQRPLLRGFVPAPSPRHHPLRRRALSTQRRSAYRLRSEQTSEVCRIRCRTPSRRGSLHGNRGRS